MPLLNELGGSIQSTTRKQPGTSPMLLLPDRSSRPYRVSFVIQNLGTVDVYIGNADVAASGDGGGILLPARAVTDPPSTPPVFADATIRGPVYGRTASGTADLRVMEVLA
jgi:hypothetical protein